MSSIEQCDILTPALEADVRRLAARIEDVAGAPPLNDQTLSQLGEKRGGLSHVTMTDGDQLVGYAQLDGTSAELAVTEQHAEQLLQAAEDAAGGELTIWTHGTRSTLEATLRRRGYERGRVLHQLRMPLHEPITVPQLPGGVTVDTFTVGRDEPAWVQLNAAAFASHAEQGSWTQADLIAREAEPWFDPAGFFLARRGAELLGFHWTKIHEGGPGEVYVIGVAPDAQGLHLGSALLAIGLQHLRERGCDEVLLYVDESNLPAMRLYERHGFNSHDVDAQWRAPAHTPG